MEEVKGSNPFRSTKNFFRLYAAKCPVVYFVGLLGLICSRPDDRLSTQQAERNQAFENV